MAIPGIREDVASSLVQNLPFGAPHQIYHHNGTPLAYYSDFELPNFMVIVKAIVIVTRLRPPARIAFEISSAEALFTLVGSQMLNPSNTS